MRRFELDENIILELPSKYTIKQEIDEDGELNTTIESGEYMNDEGMKCCEFQGNITYYTIDPDDYDEKINNNNLLDVVARSRELDNVLKLPVKPEILLGNEEMSISVLGSTLGIFILTMLIKATDNSFVLLVTSKTSEDDARCDDVFYDSIVEIAESIRIFGKKVSLEGVSPHKLEQHFESRGRENIFEYDFLNDYVFGNREQEEHEDEFRCVDPDESLYPHYAIIKNNMHSFFPGAVVNATGTEYEFHTFENMLNTYSSDPEYENRKPLLRRINELNPEGYTLGETARNMIRLFRVNKDAFVEGHDRESELLNNYMRRAYMMSALRSFAWTLADYCGQDNSSPETVEKSTLERLVNFLAMREWLNYDGSSYCKGLCSGSDLHVYFLPDAISKEDEKLFLPDQSDYDRVNNMKEQFPSYNEILSEVHSLELLRKDLEYIYPAIKVLYEDLAAHRDKSVPLEGNAADVVYAWIALAIAAEGPFFSEDGPVNYYLGWPGESEERQAQRKAETTEKWMADYGEYLENEPTIEFEGRNFVFSGLTGGKDNPVVQKVIERGGVYKSRVSGLTDYLIVEPYHSGESKICSVIEQREKGKEIKVVLLEKLETVLRGENTPAPEQDLTIKPLVLSFDKTECITVHGDLVAHVPDGFKYSRSGTGANENWIYIVPKDCSLNLDHIDAKPISFGIVPISIVTLPETVDISLVDTYKEFALVNEWFNEGVMIHHFVSSENCLFIYQRWYDLTDNKYNKMNGIIFAGNQAYQFHIFMNYDEPISDDEEVIDAFVITCEQWMKHVHLASDAVCIPTEKSDYEFGKSQTDYSQVDDSWGSGITFNGKAMNENSTGSYAVNDQNDDGWGSGITVDGKSMNENSTGSHAVNDQNDNGWGRGITVGGKKI